MVGHWPGDVGDLRGLHEFIPFLFYLVFVKCLIGKCILILIVIPMKQSLDQFLEIRQAVLVVLVFEGPLLPEVVHFLNGYILLPRFD
jgi:hypothetical protein